MASIKQANARTPQGLRPKQVMLARPMCPITNDLIAPGEGGWIVLHPIEHGKRVDPMYRKSISLYVHKSVVMAAKSPSSLQHLALRNSHWLQYLRERLIQYMEVNDLQPYYTAPVAEQSADQAGGAK